MTTNTQHAFDLMPQLRDILGLPQDLDLPRLYRITMTAFDAYNEDAGWTVDAMLSSTGKTDLQLWEGLRAWAPGATPELFAPSASSVTPSGMYRKASVSVSIGGVSVEIWAHLDGLFQPPEQVHVTGEAVNLLLGGAA